MRTPIFDAISVRAVHLSSVRRFFLLLSLAFVATAVSAADIDFARDIRPILSDKCIFCHGPDEEHRGGDLRLDIREEAFRERDGVAAFRAGDLEGSEAWFRITSTDRSEVMPPPKAHKELSVAEKDLLRKWIESGAEWTDHWAFLTPEKVAAPDATHGGFVQNDIDRFVLDAMRSKGFEPSPEADRRTLIRRLTLDLTGLLPTRDEVEAFLTDEGTDAYETLVDRLLASPRYGERMAVMWLDAARYGDTSVMHADGPRSMWPWRDWVVNAFNANQPYDRFSIEQIAGDLLPGATLEQKIASGFNRNHPSSDEGGAIPEELRVSYVVDRVKTTSNVWLGLSMECAQCHDHKYDPVSMTEYYQFYAYFNNTTDPGMQTRRGNQAPFVEVPDRSRDERLAVLTRQVEDSEKRLAAHRAGSEAGFAAWLARERGEREGEQTVAPTPAGLAHWIPVEEEDKDGLRDLAGGRTGTLDSGGKFLLADRPGAGKALRLTGKESWSFPDWKPVEADEAFTFSAWVKRDGSGAGGAIFSHMDVDEYHRGVDFWIQGMQVVTHIVNRWPGNALKVVSVDSLEKDTWHHVAVVYDGSRQASGVRIYIDGKLSENKVEADGLEGSILPKASIPFKVGGRNKGASPKAEIDDLRVYRRALSEEEVAAARHDPRDTLLSGSDDALDEGQRELARSIYLHTADEAYRKLLAGHVKRQKAVADLEAKPTTTMIMADNPEEKMRVTYVLNRGAYDQPIEDEVIEPGTPAALPPMPADSPANRLGLAQWLFEPEHPLTARVAANQVWQLLFGKGIVTTPADFGSQGAFPTHPALLDFLAVEFRESGWDVKELVRKIVLSGTYRQSSHRPPESREYDPENVWLTRAPRHRLPAEFIRDNALALSGLLDGRMGGPGVKPYQPPGLWAEVGLGGNPKFVQDTGEKLYRRSLYTYWKRSAPPPAMQIFDAPTRESCTMQRPTTNTPLQALAAMNDVQMVEAARHFAERMVHEGGATPEERSAWAFEQATARPPNEVERAALLDLYREGKAGYGTARDEAEELLAVGDSERDTSIAADEHAALTLVASLILNLDETMTRE